MRRATGWLRDPFSEDDWEASKLFGSAAGAYPPSVDRSDRVDEVLDQGQTSSCVGFAAAQAVRMALVNQGVSNPILPSPLAIYYWARAGQAGQLDRDGGTYIRAAFRAIGKFGFPPNDVWPFDESKVQDQPPWEVNQVAFDQRGLEAYFRIPTVGRSRSNYVRAALADGYPVVFGTLVDARFFDLYDARVWDFQGPTEGGHALCIVGYDEDGVLVVNSWGRGWGANGFGVVGWETIEGDTTDDFWIPKVVPNYSSEAA